MSKKARQVIWNEVIYPSIIAAAKALDVDESTVRYRMRRGYTSDSQLIPQKERQFNYNSARLTEWNGIIYPSIAAAARANNLSYVAMKGRISKGYKCDDDMVGVNATICVPCTWNRINYPSVSAAARANNISYSAMRSRLNKNYQSDKEMKAARKQMTFNSKPVEWNGFLYPSIKQAALANEIAYSAMQYRINKGYVCEGDMQRPRHPR